MVWYRVKKGHTSSLVTKKKTAQMKENKAVFSFAKTPEPNLRITSKKQRWRNGERTEGNLRRMFEFYEREYFFFATALSPPRSLTRIGKKKGKIWEVKRGTTDRSIDKKGKKSIKNECGQERIKNEIVQLSAAWERIWKLETKKPKMRDVPGGGYRICSQCKGVTMSEVLNTEPS